MDPYTLIMDSIIGFLLGIILILTYYIIKNRGRRRNVLLTAPFEFPENYQLDPAKIALLYENWIIDPDKLSSLEIKLFSSLGFIRKVTQRGVVSNYQKVREFLLTVNRVLSIEPPPMIDLHEKYFERLAGRGIKSITFVKISSEEGPIFLFTTTPTHFTRKLYSDNELLNNIFLMAGRVEEAQIEGSRILIHEIAGGERQIAGYVIIETTKNADTAKLRAEIVDRINTFPADSEEAKRFLERLL